MSQKHLQKVRKVEVKILNKQSWADEGWSSRSDVVLGNVNINCKETSSSEMLKTPSDCVNFLL